jgi:energy-coupling factor transporter ATP-binding protein EcfA2
LLKSLNLKNFTVFRDADFKFGSHLNVIVGENGAGKSHILKAAYSGIAANIEDPKANPFERDKTTITRAIAGKFLGVFRPDRLGRLVRRSVGRSKGRVAFAFDQSGLDFAFTLSTLDKIDLVHRPGATALKRPVYLPTRELLTIAPGFVSLYETTHLPFEETWRDTCILLEAPLVRGVREASTKGLLAPLEEAMGGKVEVDKAGGFYLALESGTMEMHLVAEGLRKLAMLARLIATGSLQDKGYLFWDEPESNLNPRLIKAVAKTILQLASRGIQVFVATHSLFLLRELHILQRNDFPKLDSRCFGLHLPKSAKDEVEVTVKQGKSMDDIGDIAVLDEELAQSDRYISTEMGLAGN